MMGRGNETRADNSTWTTNLPQGTSMTPTSGSNTSTTISHNTTDAPIALIPGVQEPRFASAAAEYFK